MLTLTPGSVAAVLLGWTSLAITSGLRYRLIDDVVHELRIHVQPITRLSVRPEPGINDLDDKDRLFIAGRWAAATID